MRIPDGYLPCVVFLGGRDQEGELHYRATAFLISTPTGLTAAGGIALVTARHNVRRAQQLYGNVWVRFNTTNGEARNVQITTPWALPDNDGAAADVAATPFWPPDDWDGAPLPSHWFVTDDVVRHRQVGVGDDLVVVGLFSHHVGAGRNLPIVRTGNIASMPDQPLREDVSGKEYDAYLAEVRSIGGLSGSPVLLALNPYTRLHVFDDSEAEQVGGQVFYVLGLIRGHWNEPGEVDFHGNERRSLNAGIAIVTPITELLPLLERDEFLEQRKWLDERVAADRAQDV